MIVLRPYFVPVKEFFGNQPHRIYASEELEEIFHSWRDKWVLPKSMTRQLFVTTLINHTPMQQLKLQSSHRSSPVRYASTSDPHPISVAVSFMKEGSSFSHASAFWIHHLATTGKIFLSTKSNRKSLDEAGDFHKMRSIVLFATDSDFQQCGTDTKTQESPCLAANPPAFIVHAVKPSRSRRSRTAIVKS